MLSNAKRTVRTHNPRAGHHVPRPQRSHHATAGIPAYLLAGIRRYRGTGEITLKIVRGTICLKAVGSDPRMPKIKAKFYATLRQAMEVLRRELPID
jgi:hypothetical protein